MIIGLYNVNDGILSEELWPTPEMVELETRIGRRICPSARNNTD